MNSIKVLKTACPLFLKKHLIPDDEVLFIRELHINLNTAVVQKMFVEIHFLS